MSEPTQPVCVSALQCQQGLGGRLLTASMCFVALGAPGAASAADSDKGRKDGLEEIVVTAQRRVENVRDVPISISVLGGTELAQSSAPNVSEILNRVPGVATSPGAQGGTSQISIRGVGAADVTFYGSSPVGFYLDSIPFGFVGHAIAPDLNAYDLERVEVLRGPQGTLYGASAQNGVVRVVSQDADLANVEFKVRSSVSSIESGSSGYRGDAAVSIPLISEKLAVRVVGGYQQIAGWIDKPNASDVNEGEERTLRVKLNAAPTEGLTLEAFAWLSRTDYDAPPLGDRQDFNHSPIDEPASSDYDAFGATIAYDFGPVTVSSMTSYLTYDNESTLDFAPFSAPFGLPNTVLSHRLQSKLFSEEINISSNAAGAWRWTAGAIYRHAEDHFAQTLPPIFDLNESEQTAESYAVFGEVTRQLIPNVFEVTAGLRYFEEEQDIERLSPLPIAKESDEYDKVSPRLVLTWHPQQHQTVYASYSQGFRSGLVRVPFPQRPDLPPTEPDNLTNYELGAKSALFDGVVEIDAAVYFMDWEDVQIPVAVVGSDGTGFAATINGDSASGVGVDFGISANFTSGLQLAANASWNDLSMDRDLISNSVTIFEEGERLAHSPELTVSASLNYEFSLGSAWRGEFGAAANHTSEQTFRSFDGVVGVGDDITLVRAHFAVNGQDHWRLGLFVDNLADKRGSIIVPPYAYALNWWDTRVRPRTVGIQFEYTL